MSTRPSIRIPSTRDDSLAPLRLSTVGLAAFVVGAVLARASLDTDRTREAGGRGDTRSAPTAPSPRTEQGPDAGVASLDASSAMVPADAVDAASAVEAAPGDPSPVEPVTAAAPPSPGSDVTGPAAIEPPPTVASSASGSGPAAVAHGRIAYIRCDGVPPAAGPVPCPRDLSMERAVWAAIDRLPVQCAALSTARGAADVRVVFDGARVSGLGFRDVPAPALPADAVRACLEPALRPVTQTLGATRLTASFRFDFR